MASPLPGRTGVPSRDRGRRATAARRIPPCSFSLHRPAGLSIVINLKSLVGRFQVFRVQETLLNQGSLQLG
jgi:hypothetical protein